MGRNREDFDARGEIENSGKSQCSLGRRGKNSHLRQHRNTPSIGEGDGKTDPKGEKATLHCLIKFTLKGGD